MASDKRKRKWYRGIGYAALYLFLSCGISFADSGKIIQAGSEYDYPPFCIVSEDGEADGFSVELLRAALQAVDLDVAFKVGPWNEVKEDLEQGRIQALPFVGRTPEREDIFDFTFSYIPLHGAIFVRKGDTRINTVADLAGKEVIVMKGDNAEEFARREKITPHVIAVATYEEAMRLLAAGKHDAVIAQRLMGVELLQDLGINNIVAVDHRLDKFRQDIAFAVQEGDQELLSLLNEGLAIVIADGTYDKLYKKWFGPSLLRQMSFGEMVFHFLKILVPFLFILFLVLSLLLKLEVGRKTRGLRGEIEQRKKIEQELTRYRDHLEKLVSERTKELRESRATLQIKVEERTAELQEKMKSINEMNQLMVGRELKMIELKKQINGLLAELGQAPRYDV